MPAPVLQFKRGNAGVAGTVPALRPGEPAISLNNFDFFIGIDTSVTNNKFFGSHRYWGREDGTNSLKLKLVDKDGTNGIHLKSPDTLSGIGTYIFPDTSTITPGYFLKVGAGGTLSWESVTGSASFSNASLTGITTISGSLVNNASTSNSGITTFTNTTDNTLGNADTGAVQIDGGLGINKNLTVGQNLHVAGYSEFVGVVTFRGGTINIGDSSTDNINVAGEFVSNLTPNTDNTYDLGIGTQRWRHSNFAGIGTFATGVVADGVQIGINGANVIDTVSGNLTLNSAGGQTIIDDLVTIQNNLTVNGNITVGGTTVTLRGTDVYIENKDIILGFTTSVTPNDDTANHAGVAIASTVGSPLVSFSASGVNTLPNTYKQLMWFKSGTLGFATDAFAFNYGLAIGTTSMANGVRLAVGSGITMTDTTISATTVTATTGNFTNLSGTIAGTISTATRANTVDTVQGSTNATHYLTFVTDDNASAAAETVFTDAGITYNPSTNNLTVSGDLAINGGDATTTATTFNLVNGTATSVNFAGAATALNMGATSGIATINNTTLTLPNATTVNVNGANPTFASSSTGTLTHFNTNITTVNEYGAATALLVGATSGIATIRNATFSLPNATAVNVNGVNPTFSGTSTGTLTFFNTNLTTVNAFGAATSIGIGANTGTATINNATVTLANATTFNINGANPTLASSSTGTLTLFNTNLTKVDAFQAANTIVLGSTSGITTVRNSLRVTSNLYDSSNSAGSSGQFLTVTATGIGWTTVSGVSAGTISTATRANTVDIAATNAQSGGILFGTAGNGSQVYNDADLTYNSNTNVLSVPVLTATTEVRTPAVKAGDGTTAISITNTTGAVQTNGDLSVNGNLYVSGSTTQVNTDTLTVEDRTIELGLVGGSTPSLATTWDLGILFNYNSSGAKKSGVIWEHADGRFKFGSQVTDGGGTDNNSPQITFTTYAPIEVSSLWVTDCAGTSQVISCTGTTRNLENITIDAGTF